MKRRLLKKKHLGPFQELGVVIDVTFRSGCDGDRLLDDFIEHAIEANSLQFGGAMMPREHRLNGVVELGVAGDDTATRQRLVVDWLRTRPDVESVKVSELFDLWYDELPDL